MRPSFKAGLGMTGEAFPVFVKDAALIPTVMVTQLFNASVSTSNAGDDDEEPVRSFSRRRRQEATDGDIEENDEEPVRPFGRRRPQAADGDVEEDDEEPVRSSGRRPPLVSVSSNKRSSNPAWESTKPNRKQKQSSLNDFWTAKTG